MPKKLYVDFFNEDQSMAVTTNKKTISYNMSMLDKSDNISTPFFTAGRYVCVNTPGEAQGSASMIFLDLRKNPATAKLIVNSAETNQDLKTKYTTLMEMHNSTYDLNYDKVELVEGLPPSTPG